MIAFGASDMTKAYVGSTEVTKAYLGSDLVYTKEVLPYDAKVEYLQSSGTQYINLPMTVPKANYFEAGGVIIPVYKSISGGTWGIFGGSPYQQFISNYYSYNSSTSTITYSSTVGTLSSVNGIGGGYNGVVGQETEIILSTTGKTINGTFTAMPRPLTANITAFRIFAGYRNNYRYPVKIKSFHVISGSTLLYDLIAVRKGTVGYMYDKVSGELFGNNGSGSFTVGADV